MKVQSFTCPQCGYTTYDKLKVEDGWCGHCNAWTGRPFHVKRWVALVFVAVLFWIGIVMLAGVIKR